MFRKLWPPSSAMGVSLLALAIALGGTAFAATATLVTISNKSGTHVAIVDASGALSTTARGAPPDEPFRGFQYLFTGSNQQLIAPTKATIALTDFIVGNTFDQYTNAPARVTLTQLGSASSADCNSPTFAKTIAISYVNAGQSTQVIFPNGHVLEPAASGQYWCLVATAYLKGSPGSYYLPEISYGGYVVKGTFTAPLAVAANVRSPPRNH
jgi:hypothetical protein